MLKARTNNPAKARGVVVKVRCVGSQEVKRVVLDGVGYLAVCEACRHIQRCDLPRAEPTARPFQPRNQTGRASTRDG